MYTNTIQFFQHDGFCLAFQEEGQGEPILLIHGFSSSGQVNWVEPGWFKTLTNAGYRVIAIDNRGHGYSNKSYNPAVYTPERMASDAIALLYHLGIEKAHIMGYSMGARISAFMALRVPQVIHTAIFGGLGMNLMKGGDHWKSVVEALMVDDAKRITNARGMLFRKFADRMKGDRRALSACIIGATKKMMPDDIRRITVPVLVVVGTRDEIAGQPQPLVALLSKGELLTIPDRDHMLTVGDKIYKNGVLNFLRRHKICQNG
ncbi:MAG: Hydrolase or acyltransferase [Candidatus Tokpelaia sp. JSC085]|nr:MAG: Hydrolase or acyltransferase [Candidatus Tokpelaia sp. JSC085]